MAELVFAKGVQLKRGDGGSPETFTLIPRVLSIDGPGGQSDIKDVTSHSTPGRFKQKAAGLADSGSLRFSIFYDPADPTHAAMRSDWKLGTFKNWQMILPDVGLTQYDIIGQLSNFGEHWPVDDYAKVDLEIVFSEPPAGDF